MSELEPCPVCGEQPAAIFDVNGRWDMQIDSEKTYMHAKEVGTDCRLYLHWNNSP